MAAWMRVFGVDSDDVETQEHTSKVNGKRRMLYNAGVRWRGWLVSIAAAEDIVDTAAEPLDEATRDALADVAGEVEPDSR